MLEARLTTGDDAVAMLQNCRVDLDRRSAFCEQTDWLIACATHLPGTPLLVTIHDGDRLRAHAALRVRTTCGVRVIENLGGDVADYAPLHADDSPAAELLVRTLRKRLQLSRAWVLRVDQLALEDPVTTALRSELPHSRLTPGPPMPQMCDLGENTSVSRSRRKGVNQSRSRLNRDHGGWALNSRTGAQARVVIDAVMQVRIDRDHAAGRRSQLDDAAMRAFYRAALTSLIDRDRVCVHTVDIPDGRIAGYAVVITDSPVIRVWDGRVANGWERYGAGNLCGWTALQDAIKDPAVERFDWLRGLTQEKVHNDIHRRWTLQAASSQGVDRVHSQATSAVTRLKSSLKDAVPAAARRRLIAAL